LLKQAEKKISLIKKQSDQIIESQVDI